MNTTLEPFPLRGRCIGISISAGHEGIPQGENADAFINQLTFQTCSRFLFLGASIALGHRWKLGGIMEHLARRATEYRYSFIPAGRDGRLAPIVNRIAWPDEPPVFDEESAGEMEDVIDVRQVPPPGIPTDGLTVSSRLGQFARIRALTAMRRELVMVSDFRVCLGGVAAKNLRRLPGVLEEAILTFDAGRPLYLAGVFGGTTKALCDVILRRRAANSAREAFHTPAEALSLFKEFQGAYPFPESEGPSQSSAPFDALAYAEGMSIAKLADRAFLSEDDYLTLMTTPDVGRVMQLVSLGVSNSRNIVTIPALDRGEMEA